MRQVSMTPDALKSFAPFIAYLLLALACAAPPAAEEPAIDTREPVAIMYVAAPSSTIHAAPSASAPVLTSYGNGETVSLLATRGEWAEVRTGYGSGWLRKEDLTSNKPSGGADGGSVRFRRRPSPIGSAGGAKGDIVLEALVNTNGVVMNVTTISNTTGSAELERRNREELGRAMFVPMFQGGQAKTFIYTYRVTY